MKKPCVICKKLFDEAELYEYREMVACGEHFDEAVAKRDRQRGEENAKEKDETKRFKGLDFGNSPIGKVNRKIFGR